MNLLKLCSRPFQINFLFFKISAEYDEEASHSGGYYRGGYQPVGQVHHKLPALRSQRMVPSTTLMSGGSEYQPIPHTQAYPHHYQQRRPIAVRKPYWQEEDEQEEEELVDEEPDIGYLEEGRMVSQNSH